VPNVIIDKKGQSDDDSDEDIDTAGDKNDFLGRGDAMGNDNTDNDDSLLHPKPASDDVNAEGDGDENHGRSPFRRSFIKVNRNCIGCSTFSLSTAGLFVFICFVCL